MSREENQTEVPQQGAGQVPQQGPLLQRVNKFLTLPVAPVILVLIGSLGTQAAAVLVTDMLSTVGAPGISGLRMTAAAIIMVVLFRPKLSGMTRARAINIVVYGVAMGHDEHDDLRRHRPSPAGRRRHHRLPRPLRRVVPGTENVAIPPVGHRRFHWRRPNRPALQ
ncbi:hypothetical protein [Corynebacterium amycolatum]|uniref:hypothetical protein n=1 Tax=Corynebacterium amycolatum TaxID=43765 RepID=UPI001E5552D9|nr:hypothetical protein [Corynebacterium amycolatum]